MVSTSPPGHTGNTNKSVFVVSDPTDGPPVVIVGVNSPTAALVTVGVPPPGPVTHAMATIIVTPPGLSGSVNVNGSPGPSTPTDTGGKGVGPDGVGDGNGVGHGLVEMISANLCSLGKPLPASSTQTTA